MVKCILLLIAVLPCAVLRGGDDAALRWVTAQWEAERAFLTSAIADKRARQEGPTPWIYHPQAMILAGEAPDDKGAWIVEVTPDKKVVFALTVGQVKTDLAGYAMGFQLLTPDGKGPAQ